MQVGRSSGGEEGNIKADMVGIHMLKEERFNWDHEKKEKEKWNAFNERYKLVLAMAFQNRKEEANGSLISFKLHNSYTPWKWASKSGFFIENIRSNVMCERENEQAHMQLISISFSGLHACTLLSTNK